MAMALMGLVLLVQVAGPPSANAARLKYGAREETAREHSEFLAFAQCPFGISLEISCTSATTTYKEKWPAGETKNRWEAEHQRQAPNLPSHLILGGLTIAFKGTIVLQGASTATEWFLAEHEETLLAPPEPAPSLTRDINRTLLSPFERLRYLVLVQVLGQNQVTATLELAHTTQPVGFNAIHLLKEAGTALSLAVKIRLNNPFLGPNCVLGTDERPVDIQLTTGQSGLLRGKSGSALTRGRSNQIITLHTVTLVDGSFAAPGFEHCGLDSSVDESLDSALQLPAANLSAAVINGELKITEAQNAKEGLEGKV
jgi:hypothetical protein